MTVAKVTSLLFFDRLEEITYRCMKCSIDIKRTFKRAPDWKLSELGAPTEPRSPPAGSTVAG